jgi:multiple antibiotic resistance protein
MGPAMTFQEALTQFITLFVVLDPAATIPMYLLSIRGLASRPSRLVALYAAGIAFLVLVFFIICFELLLDAMHVPLSSFQLAGSLVLLIYGLHLVFDQIKQDEAPQDKGNEGLVARAVYPLTIPGLAGPGSMMTVTLLTENHRYSMFEQAETVGIVGLCLCLIVLVFIAAGPISKVLGKGGLSIVSRVMGLIISSIALTNGIAAVKLVFNLA